MLKGVKTISNLTFGFDIDGVLTADDDGSSNIWLLRAEEFFQRPIVKPSFYIEEAFDVTGEEAERFFCEMLETVYKTVAPRPHCARVLQKLQGFGAKIHLITARDERHRALTKRWLKKHEIPYDTLWMSPPDKSYCKGTKCLKLGVDLFVDDNLENAESAAGRGIFTLLFHASHNRDRPTSLPRVKDWLEIEAYIRSFHR
ncbi:MAG TPA: hypothetical protein GX528_04730, partial [Firmicutes bacterium]|nr:hypothetical protein [Bacillota bacterium]